MPSKSFPQLPDRPWSRLLPAFLLVLVASSLPAQNAAPKDLLKREDATFIRFWNMCPRDGRLLSLVSRRGENTDPLFDNLRGFDFHFYSPMKPRKYTLRVQDNQGKILAEAPVEAAKQCYYTAIAEPDGAGVRLRIIDDTYKYLPGGPTRLTVHQFIPGLTATVSLAGQKSQPLSQGRDLVFDNVKNGDELRIQATTPQNTAFDARMPIMASRDGNHESYLILLDRYGEMVVRFTPDGFVDTPPDQPDTEQPAAPSPTP